MSIMNNKKFLVIAKRWFDKINGNTYHSVKITDLETDKVYIVGKTYGYGSHYEYTAINKLITEGLIDAKYGEYEYCNYERENNYPIIWEVIDVKRKKDLDAAVV